MCLGAQVGAGFVDEEGTKTGVYGTQLAPAGIILDAELTLATPERLWLSTGIRALDHAIGAYYGSHDSDAACRSCLHQQTRNTPYGGRRLHASMDSMSPSAKYFGRR